VRLEIRGDDPICNRSGSRNRRAEPIDVITGVKGGMLYEKKVTLNHPKDNRRRKVIFVRCKKPLIALICTCKQLCPCSIREATCYNVRLAPGTPHYSPIISSPSACSPTLESCQRMSSPHRSPMARSLRMLGLPQQFHRLWAQSRRAILGPIRRNSLSLA
jgi:hypothetical protein